MARAGGVGMHPGIGRAQHLPKVRTAKLWHGIVRSPEESYLLSVANNSNPDVESGGSLA